MPIHPAYSEKRSNLIEWVGTLEHELGQRVWDYSDVLSGDSLFANSIHVNLKGREALARILIDDGLFTIVTE